MVGDVERFVKSAKRKHRHNRPENFFLSDAHRGINVGKNRGLVEPA